MAGRGGGSISKWEIMKITWRITKEHTAATAAVYRGYRRHLGARVRRRLDWPDEEGTLKFTFRVLRSMPSDVKATVEWCRNYVKEAIDDVRPLPTPKDIDSLPEWMKPRFSSKQSLYRMVFHSGLTREEHLAILKRGWSDYLYSLKLSFIAKHRRKLKFVDLSKTSIAELRDMPIPEKTVEEERAERAAKTMVNAAKSLPDVQKTLNRSLEETITDMKDARPVLQELARDRLEVVRASLAAFTSGFREGRGSEITKLEKELEEFRKTEEEKVSKADKDGKAESATKASQELKAEDEGKNLTAARATSSEHHNVAHSADETLSISEVSVSEEDAQWSLRRRQQRRRRRIPLPHKQSSKSFLLDSYRSSAALVGDETVDLSQMEDSEFSAWAFSRRQRRRRKKEIVHSEEQEL